MRLLEVLEDRSVPAAINWTNLAGGSWHTAANWDLNRVPIAGDDVTVPSLPGTLTITYSTGNTSINSLACAENFTLSGGDLTVVTTLAVTGTFNLSGELTGATVIAPTNVLPNDGTLDAVTINGEINLGDNRRGFVKNGMTLNGTVKHNSLGSQSYLRFDGTQSIGGTGSFLFNSNQPSANFLSASGTNTTITFGPDILIHGQSGFIGSIGHAGTVTDAQYLFRGLVHADVNAGTINLVGGNFLCDVAGSVKTSNSGVVVLQGTVANGPFNIAPGSSLTLDNGTLDNATINGDLAVSDNKKGMIKNGLTLNGALRLNSLGGQTHIRFDGTQTIGGNAAFVFNSNQSNANSITAGVSNSIITFGPSVVIRGESGYIGSFGVAGTVMNATYVFQGVVGSDFNAGTIVLHNSFYRCDPTGLIQTSNFGTVVLYGTVLNGAMNIAPGSSLAIDNGTLDAAVINGDLLLADNKKAIVKNGLTLNGTLRENSLGSPSFLRFDGTQTFGGNGTVIFNGNQLAALSSGIANSTITIAPSILIRGESGFIGSIGVAGTVANATFVYQGTVAADFNAGLIRLAQGFHRCDLTGVLQSSNGGTFSLSGTVINATMNIAPGAALGFDDGTLDNATINGDLRVINNKRGFIKNGLTLNGNATLSSTGQSSYLRFDGTQTLSGTGAIVFGSNQPVANAINAGISNTTITFGPNILIRGESGSIGSTGIAGTVTNANFVYQGMVHADFNAGTINFNVGFHRFDPTSLIKASFDGTLGLIGTLLNTTVPIAAGSSVTLKNGTLDNATVNGNLIVPNANFGVIKNGLTLNGSVKLNASAAQTYLRFDSSQTLGGAASINFATNQPTLNGLTGGISATVVTLGPSVQVGGLSGYLGFNGAAGTFANVAFVNQGVIQSSAVSGLIAINGSSFSNSGILAISQPTARISIRNSFANFAANTLTGGTYNLQGALDFDNANLINNSAQLTLDGTASNIVDQFGGNGLTNLASNSLSGGLTIKGGRNLSVAGLFSNSGNISIAVGSTFSTASGNFRILAGNVAVFGTLDPFANLVIAAGTLSGNGSIAGPISADGGEIAPGASPGLLTVVGDVAITSNVTLRVELNGTNPGSGYDRLAVVGAVDLTDAALAITRNFTAPPSTPFVIVDNDGSDPTVGTFAGLPEGTAIDLGGQSFTISYVGGVGNNDVVLTSESTDFAAPVLVGVYFDGTAWTSAFRTAAGNASFGYPAQSAASQLTTMPWNTINTIYVQFSENVTIDNTDLSIRGLNVPSYVVATFTYDTVNFVAKWVLNGNFDTDRVILDLDGDSATAVTDLAGNKLAGSWTEGVSTFPTAGAAGIDFKYRFVIGVGDVDRNGLVRNADANVVRGNLFIDAGQAGYNMFADIDGNGLVRNSDTNLVRSHLFIDPPAGPGPNRPIGGPRAVVRDWQFAQSENRYDASRLVDHDRTDTTRRRMSAKMMVEVLDQLLAEL